MSDVELRDGYRDGDLVDAAHAVVTREPGIAALLSLDLRRVRTDADLMASVLSGIVPAGPARTTVYEATAAVMDRDVSAMRSAVADIQATYRKDGEPGGEVSTLLFARGAQALIGHRVVNSFWVEGRREFAFGLKTLFGRAFGTDIHPGVTLGAGLWLDHGVGFVAGETAIVEDDVSIWHGVTLGSSLKARGEVRHPLLCKGCTVGAGAIILGAISVGEGAVVAAGAVVLREVEAFTTVAGSPAQVKPRSNSSFQGFRTPDLDRDPR